MGSLEAGERVGALATETGVLRKSFTNGGPPDDLAKAKARIGELERLVGRQQADLDFFREALRSWDARRRGSGAPISSPSSKK